MSLLGVLHIVLPLVFILNTLFFIRNREHLLKNFDDKETTSVTELIYYSVNFTYFIYVMLGLFFSKEYWFITLVSIYLIKFPLFHINRKVYGIYSYLYPYILILILCSLLYTKLF